MSAGPPKPKAPQEPRPSSSVVLVSSKNEILLLHRVITSSSFPSAHVFPGGNISEMQDGRVPPPSQPDARHRDSSVYRRGALRECFEESGILLAKPKPAEEVETPVRQGKNKPFKRLDFQAEREREKIEEQRLKRRTDSGGLLAVPDLDRERGRRAVHEGKVKFPTWVKHRNGVLDLDGLIPFSRWITPTNVPKRYTTQMYLYFLPLSASNGTPNGNGTMSSLTSGSETLIPTPTSDGGKEHTAAQFLPAREWLAQANRGEIILFPPQYLLLTLAGQFLTPEDRPYSNDELAAQRQQLIDFAHTGSPPWTDKCISPRGIMFRKRDGRAVLALDKSGPEVEMLDRKGDDERVVLVKFSKEGPRQVEIMLRKDAMKEQAAPGPSEKEKQIMINRGSGVADEEKKAKL